MVHTLPASWFRWSPTGLPPLGTPIRTRIGDGEVIEALLVGRDVLLTIAVEHPEVAA